MIRDFAVIENERRIKHGDLSNTGLDGDNIRHAPWNLESIDISWRTHEY